MAAVRKSSQNGAREVTVTPTMTALDRWAKDKTILYAEQFEQLNKRISSANINADRPRLSYEAPVLLTAFVIGDERSIYSPLLKQLPVPGSRIRVLLKLVDSLASFTELAGDILADELPMVNLHVSRFNCWCRDGTYYIQVAGHDGTKVQFVPTEASGPLAQIDFLRWKHILTAAISIHVLDEKNWLLDASSLPKPWEALGEAGKFGQKFRAKLNGVTPVAVKHVTVAGSKDSKMADIDMYVQFLNEVIVSCITQGPAMLQLYGIFSESSAYGPSLDYYIVTELCAGGHLGQLLYSWEGSDKKVLPRLADNVFRQLLMELFSGLSYLHENNVVHRNLRPEHIMLIRPLKSGDSIDPGLLKIVGYAECRFFSLTSIDQGYIAPFRESALNIYLAPEVLGPSVQDLNCTFFRPKSDIYACGLIAWEMFIRESPFEDLLEYGEGEMRKRIQEGEKMKFSSEFPPGLVTLITKSCFHDVNKRIDASEALAIVQKQTLMSQWQCSTWNEIAEAMESDFWQHTRLQEQISDGLKKLDLYSFQPLNGSLKGVDRMILQMEKISKQDGAAHKEIVTYVEAVHTYVLHNEAPFAASEARTTSELICTLAKTDIDKRCRPMLVDIALRALPMDPEAACWVPFIKEVVTTCSGQNEDQDIFKACVCFLMSTLDIPQLQDTVLESHIADICRDIVAKFPDQLDLQLDCAKLLLKIAITPENRAGITRNVDVYLHAMQNHRESLDLATAWTIVLKQVTSNPLSNAEIIRAGGIPTVLDCVELHKNELNFLREAFSLLCNISSEPEHVEKLVKFGGLKIAMQLLEEFKSDVELSMVTCQFLGDIFYIEPHRHHAQDTNVVKASIEAMQRHTDSPKMLSTALWLLARLTLDDSPLVNDALYTVNQGIFLKSMTKFRDDIDIIHPGLILIGNLAADYSERSYMLEHDVLRLIINSLRHFNENTLVQEDGLRALSVFASDKTCRSSIDEVGGIATTMVAMQKHNSSRDVMQNALELLQKFVTDPSTRQATLRNKIVHVLATILREESGRPELLFLSVGMLTVLVHHENIHEEFMEENMKLTLEALMQAFPNNASLQHHGQAAIQVAMPELSEIRDTTFPFKVVVVGKLSVGKTSLLKRACQNTFSPDVQSTVGVHIDFAKIEFPSHHVTLQVYDTAGEERFRSLTRSFYRGAHGAILVYDVSRNDSFEELQSYAHDIKAAVPHDVILMVVGTKMDLKDKHRVEASQARRFARSIGARHHVVSSLQNIGVHKAFRDLTERLLRRWPAGPPADPTLVSVNAETNKPNFCCNS
eukprot:m.81228 g.81228  ORF g.81228 m.81228 type:complete len:1293 (-) comp12800_c0_seq2:110-3988(-)